jgi:hypothetical protein
MRLLTLVWERTKNDDDSNVGMDVHDDQEAIMQVWTVQK